MEWLEKITRGEERKLRNVAAKERERSVAAGGKAGLREGPMLVLWGGEQRPLTCPGTGGPEREKLTVRARKVTRGGVGSGAGARWGLEPMGGAGPRGRVPTGNRRQDGVRVLVALLDLLLGSGEASCPVCFYFLSEVRASGWGRGWLGGGV